MKSATPAPLSLRAEAGYSLVVLIVLVAVLNVMIAAMLPLWSTAIRRDKEEELIFRGFQYAEAIRVYQMRNQGQLPTKLEQLIEVKPRCIRQLWKDPMTKDGTWGLIFLNQPQNPVNRQQGENPPPGNPDEGAQEDEAGRPRFAPGKGDVEQVGPIIGVHSRSGEKSILVFFGKERYDEWQFTVNQLLNATQGPPGGGPGAPSVGGVRLSLRWLGRPSPFELAPGTQPQDGSLPGDPQGSGQGNRRGGAGRRGLPSRTPT